MNQPTVVPAANLGLSTGITVSPILNIEGLGPLQALNVASGVAQRRPANLGQHVEVFDIDGPVARPPFPDPESKVINGIISRLAEGDLVAFNTGRSIRWTIDQILRPLVQRISADSLPEIMLPRFMAVVENGTAWIEYQNDRFNLFVDSGIQVPQLLRNTLEQLEQEFKLIRLDKNKLGIATLEFCPRPGEDIGSEFGAFESIKPSILERAKELISQAGLANNFIATASKSAVDVFHVNAGKERGAAIVHDWLNRQAIRPRHITTIGDSEVDLAMGAYFERAGLSVTHVHVGDAADIENAPIECEVVVTKGRFTEGSLEFLEDMEKLKGAPLTNAALLSNFSRYHGLVEAISPWYDRLFLTANRIEIDSTARIIKIQVSASDQPVRLTDKVQTPVELPTVEQIRNLGKDGSVPITRDQKAGICIIGDRKKPILFSSGQALFQAGGEFADDRVVLIERNSKLEYGYLQVASGRCDKGPGASALQEGVEEIVLLVEGKSGPEILIVNEASHIAVPKLKATAWRARDNALQTLRQKLGAIALAQPTLAESPWAAMSGPGIRLETEIELLRSVQAIRVIEARDLMPVPPHMETFTVNTYLDDQLIETNEGMTALYDEPTNTLEVRSIFRFNTNQARVIGVFDGDGFGRTVKFFDLSELRAAQKPISISTQRLLEAYWGAKL